jgi:hypothetical protein
MNDGSNRFGMQAADFGYDEVSAAACERFLGDLGCAVPEEQALAANGGTLEMFRKWDQSPAFRAALKKCRAMGETDRRDAAAKAERRQDVFATPPRPGAVDPAAMTYDVADPPRGGLARWLRRVGLVIDRAEPEKPAPEPGGRWIPISELTPADAQAIGRQRDEAEARVQAEQAAARGDDPGNFVGQPWNRKTEHIAPDGSGWVGAPAQQAGGLFSHTPDPDSVPTQ